MKYSDICFDIRWNISLVCLIQTAGSGLDVLRACILEYRGSQLLERRRAADAARREQAYFEARIALLEHRDLMRHKRRMYTIMSRVIEQHVAQRCRESSWMKWQPFPYIISTFILYSADPPGPRTCTAITVEWALPTAAAHRRAEFQGAPAAALHCPRS